MAKVHDFFLIMQSQKQLTGPPDEEAVGGLQRADFVACADVQAVHAGGGESVLQLQCVLIQHGQLTPHRRVRHTVGQDPPAHPHRGTGESTHTHTHTHRCI